MTDDPYTKEHIKKKAQFARRDNISQLIEL